MMQVRMMTMVQVRMMTMMVLIDGVVDWME
jgi:hypothetical protein